jgi:hypothetical protein
MSKNSMPASQFPKFSELIPLNGVQINEILFIGVYNECNKMLPGSEVSDINRDLEKNDERYQILLIDTIDATEAHRNDRFVIITDSVNETWDATEEKGIKSVYSIKGTQHSTSVGKYVYI